MKRCEIYGELFWELLKLGAVTYIMGTVILVYTIGRVLEFW